MGGGGGTFDIGQKILDLAIEDAITAVGSVGENGYPISDPDEPNQPLSGLVLRAGTAKRFGTDRCWVDLEYDVPTGATGGFTQNVVSRQTLSSINRKFVRGSLPEIQNAPAFENGIPIGALLDTEDPNAPIIATDNGDTFYPQIARHVVDRPPRVSTVPTPVIRFTLQRVYTTSYPPAIDNLVGFANFDNFNLGGITYGANRVLFEGGTVARFQTSPQVEAQWNFTIRPQGFLKQVLFQTIGKQSMGAPDHFRWETTSVFEHQLATFGSLFNITG